MNDTHYDFNPTVEVVKHNGYIIISDIVNGYIETRTYVGYSIEEAKALFIEDIKELIA